MLYKRNLEIFLFFPFLFNFPFSKSRTPVSEILFPRPNRWMNKSIDEWMNDFYLDWRCTRVWRWWICWKYRVGQGTFNPGVLKASAQVDLSHSPLRRVRIRQRIQQSHLFLTCFYVSTRHPLKTETTTILCNRRYVRVIRARLNTLTLFPLWWMSAEKHGVHRGRSFFCF